MNVIELIGTADYTATGTFTRDNCGEDYEGTEVTFEHTATKTATGSSQEEADQLAQARAEQAAQEYVDENGQDYANTNGQCIQVVFKSTKSWKAKKSFTKECDP